MSDGNAKYYADLTATEENWEVIYQSFRDGYIKGQHDRVKEGLWKGIMLGVSIGIAVCVVAIVLIDKYFRPILLR